MVRLVRAKWIDVVDLLQPPLTRAIVLDMNEWLDAFDEAQEEAHEKAKREADQNKPKP